MKRTKSTLSFGDDPFATADWQRATTLLESKQRPNRHDDEQTRIILKYMKASPRMQRKHFPDLAAAHQLHDKGGALVDEVQARLLAGEAFDTITTKTGISSSVLRAYEATYFAVANHLQATTWLMDKVLQTHRWVPANLTRGQIWKWIALSAGPIALDLLIAENLGRAEPNIPDRAGMAEKARLSVRMAITPNTPADSLQLMKEGALLYGWVGKKGQPSFSNRPMLQSMYNFLRMAAKKHPKPRHQRKRKQEAALPKAESHAEQQQCHAAEIKPQTIDMSLGIGVVVNEDGMTEFVLAETSIA